MFIYAYELILPVIEKKGLFLKYYKVSMFIFVS